MTKVRDANVDRSQPATGSIDDEACRRVLISLYGSEAEAMAVADAMLRKMTAEEEAVIDKLYDAGDEIARQLAEQDPSRES